MPGHGWARALLALALCLGLAACASEQETRISALHHFRKGNEAFRIEDYANAIRHYNAAIEMDDTSAEIRYNLGLAYYKTDNLPQAVEAFNGALAIDPNMADAHYNLALAYDKLYNPEAAHAHFNTYRQLTAGGPKKKDDQQGATAKPGSQGATHGQAPAKPKLAGGKPGNPQAARAAAPPHPARPPVPSAQRPPVPPAGRQAALPTPAAPAPSDSTPGGTQKWWTQDRFTRTP